MLFPTEFTIDTSLIEQLTNVSTQDMKTVINEPTGNFFYDPWVIKKEYAGTVWAELLKPLPNIGEARIIELQPGQCYQSHADIDDRYHLNIRGEKCYLIDLEFDKTYKLYPDGIWYEMEAGRLHSAANFGRYSRTQLVVRKLLLRGSFKNPINIRLTPTITNKDDARFIFDNTVSSVLNSLNKLQVIDNFSFDSFITITIENDMIEPLKNKLPPECKLEIL